MLIINNICKTYGIEPVLKEISFSVNRGEKVGLVGPNGCGKSTLLRIIAGCERADFGTVQLHPADIRVGYLPQGMDLNGEDTIGSYLGNKAETCQVLVDQLAVLAAKLALSLDDPSLQDEYDKVLGKMQSVAESERRRTSILASMGLGHYSPETPCSILSGGQKTRLSLAKTLIMNPQLLLLDEPTNHLDVAMLEWLEEYLSGYQGGILVVSHDRAFLDGLCTGIVEINAVTHTSRMYSGTFSEYMVQKQGEVDKEKQVFADQQVEIASLKAASAHLRGLARFRKGGKTDGGDKFAKGFFANRSRGTIGRAKNIEARLDRLLHEDRLEKPRSAWKMRIDFEGVPESGQIILALNDLKVGYSGNILLRDLNLTLYHGSRVVLVGENGCGKTTLLRTITGEVPALSGTVKLGASIRPGYMSQDQEDLDPGLTVLQTAALYRSQSETEVRAFLHKFLFSGDDVFLPVANLSYGERARLSLACLIAKGCNFLMLDEPINHLDIPSRERFEESLHQFDGSVLAVVHDRYFISRFATHIWEVAQGTIRAQ